MMWLFIWVWGDLSNITRVHLECSLMVGLVPVWLGVVKVVILTRGPLFTSTIHLSLPFLHAYKPSICFNYLSFHIGHLPWYIGVWPHIVHQSLISMVIRKMIWHFTCKNSTHDVSNKKILTHSYVNSQLTFMAFSQDWSWTRSTLLTQGLLSLWKNRFLWLLKDERLEFKL